jgi:translation initiation factor 3 subunit F
VKVSGLVVVTILNSYAKRSTSDCRVVGALLGEKLKDGTISVRFYFLLLSFLFSFSFFVVFIYFYLFFSLTIFFFQITDCFSTPLSEKNDELYAVVNQDYLQAMYSLHKRNNPKEVIVGWFATPSSSGELLNHNSAVINDTFANICPMPIHIVVDTNLQSEAATVRGFVSRKMSVNNQVLASSFLEVNVNVEISETERICLYHMIRGQEEEAWEANQVISNIAPGVQMNEEALEKLFEVISDVQKYVDAVVEGRVEPMQEVGVAIAEAIDGFLLDNSQTGALNSAIQNKVNELLMVSCLSTLTQAQAQISSRLNQVL